VRPAERHRVPAAVPVLAVPGSGSDHAERLALEPAGVGSAHAHRSPALRARVQRARRLRADHADPDALPAGRPPREHRCVPAAPTAPPFTDPRTYDGRSLDADSPSVLIDADTNEHIIHFLELDAHAAGAQIPSRQAVFLRPGKSLTPGHRYIVAMRNLKTAAN